MRGQGKIWESDRSQRTKERTSLHETRTEEIGKQGYFDWLKYVDLSALLKADTNSFPNIKKYYK